MYIITNSLQELMFDAILDTVGISGNCQITLKIQLGVVQDSIMFLFSCIALLIWFCWKFGSFAITKLFAKVSTHLKKNLARFLNIRVVCCFLNVNAEHLTWNIIKLWTKIKTNSNVQLCSVTHLPLNMYMYTYVKYNRQDD